jgi:hypothetical protein
MIDRGYNDVWWAEHKVAKAPAAKEVSDAAKEVAETKLSKPSTAKSGKTKMAQTSPSKPKLKPKLKPEIRAPRPGESYFNYCVSKANQLERAVYCGDGSFNDLVVAERRIVDRDTALLEFCALRASAAGRRKYCGD